MSTSEWSRQALQRIATELEQFAPVEVGTMFRSPGIRTGSTIVAFLGSADRLIVKLPRARAVELVERGRVEFVTMGARTMREWVAVPASADPASTEAEWLSFAREALQYVRHPD
ncbi:MAG: hypothetical protein ABWX65_04300 [Mycetocola sp.]